MFSKPTRWPLMRVYARMPPRRQVHESAMPKDRRQRATPYSESAFTACDR